MKKITNRLADFLHRAYSFSIPQRKEGLPTGSAERLRTQKQGFIFGYFWVLALALFASPVQAEVPAKAKARVDIPAQSAITAVKALARVYQRSLLFQTDTVTVVQTNPVQGRFNLNTALEALFEGTPLKGGITKRGAIVVFPRNDNTPDKGEIPMNKDRLSTAAIAAALAASQAAAQSNEAVLEEILVTASKRGAQSIQEIPYSIQSLGGNALKDASIRDIAEAITLVPGASEGLSNNAGARQYQIRGINQQIGAPTVGYYFGDAAFNVTSFAPAGRLFDMDRVEVLRGPQSTLYGNGAMGGVVRFIPNAPSLTDFEAGVRAGYADVTDGSESQYLDGYVSIPVVEDKAGLRIVAGNESVGGFADTPFIPANPGFPPFVPATEAIPSVNDADEADITDMRASLLIRPTDELQLDFLWVSNETEHELGTLMSNNTPPISASLPGDFVDTEFDIYSGTIAYDFGNISFSSTFTALDVIYDLGASLPFGLSPTGLLSISALQDFEGFNNETRLVSTGESPLQWVLGVFYSDVETEGGSTTNLPSLLPDNIAVATNESLSVFAEISYEVMDGKLIPLFGIRYYEEDIDQQNTNLIGGIPFADPTQSASFDSVNPRFNLSYLPDENATYYLNIAKGFRSGGFNPANLVALGNALFGREFFKEAVESDEVWSYEIGTKQTFADGQLVLDAAIYYMEWQDTRQPIPAAGLFMQAAPGDGELYGVDVGLTYQPAGLEGLSLTVSGNLNSSEFTDVDDDALAFINTDFSGLLVPPPIGPLPPVVLDPPRFSGDGARLPLVPEYTFSVMAAYETALGDSGWNVSANSTFSLIGGQVGQFGGSVEGDDRNLLRARLGVRNDRFGIYLVGTNLLDEDTVIYNQQPLGGAPVVTRDYPRTLGLEVTADF